MHYLVIGLIFLTTIWASAISFAEETDSLYLDESQAECFDETTGKNYDCPQSEEDFDETEDEFIPDEPIEEDEVLVEPSG